MGRLLLKQDLGIKEERIIYMECYWNYLTGFKKKLLRLDEKNTFDSVGSFVKALPGYEAQPIHLASPKLALFELARTPDEVKMGQLGRTQESLILKEVNFHYLTPTLAGDLRLKPFYAHMKRYDPAKGIIEVFGKKKQVKTFRLDRIWSIDAHSSSFVKLKFSPSSTGCLLDFSYSKPSDLLEINKYWRNFKKSEKHISLDNIATFEEMKKVQNLNTMSKQELQKITLIEKIKLFQGRNYEIELPSGEIVKYEFENNTESVSS